MYKQYEAHPLAHAGEPEVTVEFTVPDAANSAEQAKLFREAEEEVKRRERLAGFTPIAPVVFCSHQQSA